MDEIMKYSQAVRAIRKDIEKSRYRAARAGNAEMLSLHYGIGKYFSENTHKGTWGTDAIQSISRQLQQELPGLRGYSESNIKNMRQFYQEWQPFVNRQPTAGDSEIDGKSLLMETRQQAAGDLGGKELLSVGFSLHMEIIAKAKYYDERVFYIHQRAVHAWDKYALLEYLRSFLYQDRASSPNNFDRTPSPTQYAVKAAKAFKENFLLGFINIENLGEADEDIHERVIENEIVKSIKDFLIRFGTDFIFMGNQHRIEMSKEEMFIGLLFFNRELNYMIAVELKAGKFRPSYLGQMNTYLSVLDDTVRKPHENPFIGQILCKDMNKAFVDYVIRDYGKPPGVATYSTAKDMSEKMRKSLPDAEQLKRLLELDNTGTDLL